MLSTLNEVIAGRKVGWVLEADLKDFFGSLDHGWLLRFVEHPGDDPRILSLIRRRLKAGILEDGELRTNEQGTPQGGSISVLLSNIYLHYVLDLWFDRVVKPRLKGEAYLVRYVDDFVVCFQFRSDALRFQSVLERRLTTFKLALQPSKTRLVEFGRFAARHAPKYGLRRPETFAFLGFTHYCTRNKQGNFQVGRRTEKSRLRRSLLGLTDLMQRVRHLPLGEQVQNPKTLILSFAGTTPTTASRVTLGALCHMYRQATTYWRKMLSSRNREGRMSRTVFLRILARYPL